MKNKNLINKNKECLCYRKGNFIFNFHKRYFSTQMPLDILSKSEVENLMESFKKRQKLASLNELIFVKILYICSNLFKTIKREYFQELDKENWEVPKLQEAKEQYEMLIERAEKVKTYIANTQEDLRRRDRKDINFDITEDMHTTVLGMFKELISIECSLTFIKVKIQISKIN